MEPDAPTPSPLDVDGFFVNATDLVGVLNDLPAVDAPSGFVRLDLSTVAIITRDLQVRRIPLSPGESHWLAYLPDGRFLVGEQGVDTYGAPDHHLDRGRLVIVECEALRSPIGPGAQYQPNGRQDRVDHAKRDAAAVARWHVDSTGRTWEVGTPHPAPVPDDSPMQMLSAKARRLINQHVRRTLDNLPVVALADGVTLVFRPDGSFIGLNYIPEPHDHHLTYTIGPETDPDEDVSRWLDRVRVRPSGKVEVLA
jgi:hypothetical protein